MNLVGVLLGLVGLFAFCWLLVLGGAIVDRLPEGGRWDRMSDRIFPRTERSDHEVLR